MIKGVLDRIEDHIATILVEELGEQFTVPQSELPPGSREGTWFTLNKTDHSFIIIGIDEEETARASQQSQKLMERLQAKKRVSKFKRK